MPTRAISSTHASTRDFQAVRGYVQLHQGKPMDPNKHTTIALTWIVPRSRRSVILTVEQTTLDTVDALLEVEEQWRSAGHHPIKTPPTF
ncbi:hypothetical protein B0H13DRAFT_2372581 [Mycena leptocephala]|nr:hypothetical protein B0H13DRAFT_2372581 [Mycena leptocephala]